MRRILDSHSSIACPPESAFLVQAARILQVERSREGLRNMGFDDDQVLAELRRFTCHFFEQYMERKGKVRWADKSGYLQQATLIDQMFEGEVVYVGMIRNGLDVCYSLCEMDWTSFGSVRAFLEDDDNRPLAAARYWCDRNRRLWDFAQQVRERFHLIRYEDLTTDPLPVLSGLFSFLGEPFEPEVMDYNRFSHDQGTEDYKVTGFSRIMPNSARYKAWPRDVTHGVLAVMASTLERLGYTSEV